MNNKNEPKVLDHNYDGIQELDNPLPNWWLLTFYGAVVFGIGYFAYYQLMGGPTPTQEYAHAMVHHKEVKDGYIAELSQFDQERFDRVLLQQDVLSFGKSVYNSNCLSCHAENGAGDIGPNLTDDYWLLSDGKPSGVYPFVISGNPAAGMPAWGEFLDQDELYAVTAYVQSLRGMKHEKAKEAEGDYFGPAGGEAPPKK